MRLFSKLFRRSAPPRRATPLPYVRLTLDDWRSSPERVAYVAELLRAPLFLELLGMLSNVRTASRSALDATTASFLLGQRSGQDLTLASLVAAGTQSAAPLTDLPAPDYSAENVMAAWDAEADA